MNSSSEPVIRTSGLTKRYPTRTAVSDLDLTIPRGVVFGLLGENGAGKSTTIRLLLGLIRPTQGQVFLFEQNLAQRRLQLLARVGCLVEGPAFYPYLSGSRNLQLLGNLSGGVTPGQVASSLERVGLGERGQDRYGDYSTGMRQRLGIAAAILHDPELIILDEPMSGLDPPAILLMRQLIRELSEREGKTILICSHRLHEVELSCDRVAILKSGRLVTQGEVSTLLKPGHDRYELSVSQVELAAQVAQSLPFVVSAQGRDGSRLAVELSESRPGELNRALVEAGLEVTALVPLRRTLEELFCELAGVAS